MTRDPHELISAFVDGETVEAEALGAALAGPGGREALMDFIALRSALEADALRPSAEFYAAMGEALAPRRPRHLAAAALLAAALVLAAAGLWRLGAGTGGAPTVRTSPAAVTATGESRPKPPDVMRVIRFTPGVDWHSES